MKELIEILAIFWVVIASSIQSYFCYKLVIEMKILEKSKDIFDYKKVIEKPIKEKKEIPNITDTPLYHDN